MSARPISHGGDIYSAARETGLPLRRILDFSASINPLGPSPLAARAIAEAGRLVPHYPDPHGVALREALAHRQGLSFEHLVLGNGSIEFIYSFPQVLGVQRAIVVGPTFSEYARALARFGVQVKRVNARRTEGYRPPLERVITLMRAAARTPDVVVLCQPNSPTGQVLEREEVGRLIEAAHRRRSWVLLDETFIEYCPERSMMAELNRYPRLLILRSFTKFYALPGLRIGYLAGARRVIRAFRAHQPPWSVNVLAQHAALASLQDAGYVDRSRRVIEEQRDSLSESLRSVKGMRVYPSAANFLLLELPPPFRASHVASMLRKQGLLIRDCSGVSGLTDRTVRIAVRTGRENQRLIRAMRGVLGGM
ncbi:threonine-phosphate decarboxylase CobD [Candidatus Nitrospira bockiana]